MIPCWKQSLPHNHYSDTILQGKPTSNFSEDPALKPILGQDYILNWNQIIIIGSWWKLRDVMISVCILLFVTPS